MMSRVARRKAYNAIFVVACFVATGIAIGALALILYSLIEKGAPGINATLFLVDTRSPCDAADTTCIHGGLRNAFVGSALMLAVAMLIALSVGILAGTWLSEYGGETPYGHVVRFLNDVLLSAPSILVGVAIWQLLVKPWTFSGWAGSVALAVLAAPVVTRTTEDILQLQSSALREAGSALGTPHWQVVRKIVWRAAGGGLATGGLLAFARISGETAPLLVTAGGNNFFSLNMSGWMANVPQVIFNNAENAFPDLVQIAWAGSLVMALVVLAVNIIGRIIAREQRR